MFLLVNQNSTLQHYTQYGATELRGCLMDLHRLCSNAHVSTLPAVRDKYSQHKVSFVYSFYQELWWWCFLLLMNGLIVFSYCSTSLWQISFVHLLSHRSSSRAAVLINFQINFVPILRWIVWFYIISQSAVVVRIS